MFYGSDEFNSAIENTHGNAPKTLLKFADDEILDLVSSIRYYGGSNDSDDVSIGTTTMARVEVSAYTDKLLTNREFLLEQGIELANGVVEYMPIGYFTIQKPSGDIDQVTFTAYDRMQKFEKPYSSSLAYPTTSILILDELCQICGIELATTLDNAIEVTENLKGYTCREVLGYIASMHSSFACIDRYGKLNLRWYSDTPIEKNLKKIWHFEKSQDNFEIAKVEIAKDSETNYVSGSGITTLHNSNPLATQEITDDIFAKLGGFSYSVGEIEMLDDARLDPWDMISVEYYDGKTYNIPCMTLEHDFKAYSTTVKSVGKSESENEYRFTGPTIQYLNRMAADLLVANRVIATKVDAEYVNSVAITTENFDAKVAEIKELIVEEIDGKYANIDLANIDIANINVGKIGELFAKVGLIDRATIVEGHITGFLDAVEVNANKITAGTLVADRILLSGGEEGVLYALNNLGELTSTNVDTLDGYVLTDRTINADKLIANSITANELDVNQIFGNEAVLNKIVSQDIFTDAIETNRIIVGASKNANKALQEVNKTVKSITMHYLATTLASGVTTATSGWTTTVQQIDATKKYLWTYQTITYVDNTTTDTSPVISGVYGNEGKDGKDGADGKDGIDGTNGTNGTNGVGVTSVIPLYYLKSNTTAPSAPTSAVTSTAVSSGVWTKSVPTYVNGYTYFTCTQTQYTNGTYSWSTVVIDNALTNANSTAYTANTTANGIKNNIYKSGTTLIDGAKIYTGSITADKIDVDDLFAEDITATGTIRGAILKSINYDEDTGVGMLLDLNNATIESRGEDFVNIFDSKGHYGRYTLAPEGMIFAEERDYLTGQPNLSITNGQLTLNNVKYNSYGINYGGSDIINWTTKGIATPKLSTDLIYCNGEIAAKTIKASVVQNSTYNLQSVGNIAVQNKQDIATINSNLTDMLRKVVLRKTVTISANSYLGVDIPVEVEEGYTASHLVGYLLNNTNVTVYNFYLYDTETATISLKNWSSSAQTVNIIVHAVAEKNIFY